MGSRTLTGEVGVEQAPERSAIDGSHDDVDGAQNRHDVGDFVALEDVRKDLEVVAVSSPDLEAPGGDIVVALQKHANFAFA